MKSIAVIGAGQFGTQVAVGLSQKGYDVVLLDKEEERVEELKDMVGQAIVLDSLDEKAMRAVNIDHIDTAVVAIGTNVQASLLTTALLQKLGIEDIYVRAISPLQESILQSMGIENIINIEKEMGIQISNTITDDRVGRYIALSNRHSLMEIKAPQSFVKKTLKELDVRQKYRINVVGIKTQKAEVSDKGEVLYQTHMTDVPDPDYALKKDDLLVIAGTDENLNKFMKSGEYDQCQFPFE